MTDGSHDWGHVSVLRSEAIALLAVRSGGVYLDATLGAGGHGAAILAADPTVRLVGVDRDETALEIARDRLGAWGDRVTYVHSNFADYQPEPGQTFDGILADLGVSSMQFDRGDRGFSFRHDAPLDMRMDQRQPLTAAAVVNTWDEVDLANLIYEYGEERLSRRIARRIVEGRPFETTGALAMAIFHGVPASYRHGRIHPATRTFQALRLAVNGELDALDRFLEQAPTWLAPGGRIALISFHSLEDRRVKHGLRQNPDLTLLTKKPILPTEAEQAANPRSRSAKLRGAERRTIPEGPSGQAQGSKGDRPPSKYRAKRDRP